MFPSQDQELFLGTAKQETTKNLKSQTKAICSISFFTLSKWANKDEYDHRGAVET